MQLSNVFKPYTTWFDSCKQIYLGKEDTFPHQLTKFERAKKRTNVKGKSFFQSLHTLLFPWSWSLISLGEEKDDISIKEENKPESSEGSDEKPEPKKIAKTKSEKSGQATQSEDKKGKKNQDEKENNKEVSKDIKKNKLPIQKEKSTTVVKEKGNIVKNIEDITKEIKKNFPTKDFNKKIERKPETKKIAALITKPSKGGDKLKKTQARSESSDESSPGIRIEKGIDPESLISNDKKTTIESSLIRQTSSKESKDSTKEPPKPSKSDSNKTEKSKEEDNPEEKKFTKPKIKRELKQLLKMNDEINDFSRLYSEESFELSNSQTLDDKSFNQSEPRKIIRSIIIILILIPKDSGPSQKMSVTSAKTFSKKSICIPVQSQAATSHFALSVYKVTLSR